MRDVTEASFRAGAKVDPETGDTVIWLAPRNHRGRQPLVVRDVARRGMRALRSAMLGGMCCLAGEAVPNAALAPVSVALAGVPALPELPLFDLEGTPQSSGDVRTADDPTVAALLSEARRLEENLRFGTVELPRQLVETIVRAALATDVDPIYLMALADKESSFRPTVRASTSSAQGLFQFIDRTWLETVQSYGGRHGLASEAALIATADGKPVVADPDAKTRILDLRRDPYLSAVMAAELLKQDAALIGFRIGRRLTNTEMYLAHFLGAEDAGRFIELRGARKP